jgi:hypothetical protein
LMLVYPPDAASDSGSLGDRTPSPRGSADFGRGGAIPPAPAPAPPREDSTLVAPVGDGDRLAPGSGPPCAHHPSWKRLRAKRGYAYFVCYACGAKWRTIVRAA